MAAPSVWGVKIPFLYSKPTVGGCVAFSVPPGYRLESDAEWGAVQRSRGTELAMTIPGRVGRCQHAARESLTGLGRKPILSFSGVSASNPIKAHFSGPSGNWNKPAEAVSDTLLKKAAKNEDGE
jgi:hypothetical protein